MRKNLKTGQFETTGADITCQDRWLNESAGLIPDPDISVMSLIRHLLQRRNGKAHLPKQDELDITL